MINAIHEMREMPVMTLRDAGLTMLAGMAYAEWLRRTGAAMSDVRQAARAARCWANTFNTDTSAVDFAAPEVTIDVCDETHTYRQDEIANAAMDYIH